MRKSAVLLFALAACAHQTQAPPQTSPQNTTRKYVMIMGANHAGTQVTTSSGDTRTVDFEFNDRGRGPKTHTVMTTDAHAITMSLKNEGNDYFKAPVNETFANGAWSNGAEKGSAASNAFYVS